VINAVAQSSKITAFKRNGEKKKIKARDFDEGTIRML
jgi:hypothetical protein